MLSMERVKINAKTELIENLMCIALLNMVKTQNKESVETNALDTIDNQ